MAYLLLWTFLMVTSVVMSFAAFFWAVRTGQFSDQARARYLPLIDNLSMTTPVKSSKFLLPVFALCIVLVIGMLVILVTVFLVLFR